MTKTYKCNKCAKTFDHKNDYQKHISRKYECQNIVDPAPCFECPKCHKTFARKFTLDRHMMSSCTASMDSGGCAKKWEQFAHGVSDTPDANNADELEYTDDDNSCISERSEFIESDVLDSIKCAKDCLHLSDCAKSKYECEHCGQYYSTNSNLHKHLRRCKYNLTDVQKLQQEIERLREENSRLKTPAGVTIGTNSGIGINGNNNTTDNNDNSTNDNSTTNNNNSTTINNIVNNNVNNINVELLPFGKEDISFITETEFMRMLNKGYVSVEALVKTIHFNKSKPENHNVYVSNLRDSNAHVYDGENWICRTRGDVIDEVYTTSRDILWDKYEELEPKLPEHVKGKCFRFFNDEKDVGTSGPIKKKLTLMLYNNRFLVVKNKK